jgi:aspartyl-tRNA(Asn)/glutamyl-tRNA(Gln) amidotransferase subunit A
MRTCPTLAETMAALAQGATTSAALTRELLERIASQDAHGGPSYLHVDAEAACDAAAAADARRRVGGPLPPLLGVPISVKDLFDIAGEVTMAGSAVLADEAPAGADAEAMRSMRGAGALLLGRTNMTEFAFSTIGLNPHRGTPRNPADPGRIPGGSSSGAATSVAFGLAIAAIGSDTAGSVRIPAAFCGLAGFKPTQRRVSRQGMVPLSPSLDSVGPIAPTIACCATIDAVLAGEETSVLPVRPIAGLRLALPPRALVEGMDAIVAAAFDDGLRTLRDAGAVLVECGFTQFDTLDESDVLPAIVASEALAWHRDREADWDRYDARVARRLFDARTLPAGAVDRARAMRAAAIADFEAAMAGLDGLLMPTVPIVAPWFEDVADEDDFHRFNRLIRRNPGVVNLLDGCAATIPCHRPGTLPVGLSLMGANGTDRAVLSAAAAIEAAIAASAR